MRKIAFVIVLTLSMSFTSIAQNINWVTFEQALALQKKNPKKIMMDVYTNWCGPCKMLDKNTFQNPDVAKYVNDNYYAVKFDAEGNEKINYKGNSYDNKGYKAEMASRRNSVHDLTHALQVNAYPISTYQISSYLFFNTKAPSLPVMWKGIFCFIQVASQRWR